MCWQLPCSDSRARRSFPCVRLCLLVWFSFTRGRTICCPNVGVYIQLNAVVCRMVSL